MNRSIGLRTFPGINCLNNSTPNSFVHSDKQLELNLKNEYPNKTEHNLKTNRSISITEKVSDSA